MIKADIIPHRVIEVLTKTPPFHLLSEDDLTKLIRTIKVSFKKKDEILFEVNQSHNDYFYLLERGSIKLTNTEHELVTICDEGEILGIAAFLRSGPYLLNAICDEECIIYEIPWEHFSPLLERSPEISLYFASGFATGKLNRLNFQSELLIDAKTLIAPKEGVITARRETTLLTLAQLMREEKIGSIVIIDKSLLPVGMVTKSDIVFQIANGKVPTKTLAEDFMASPVKVFKSPISYSEIILIIMSESIRHLVFTEDGTLNSKVTGILSEHDVLASIGENPILLAKQINEAESLNDLKDTYQEFELFLKRFIKDSPSINFLMRASTQINDLITNWIINYHVNKLSPEIQSEIKDKWAWLAFGSQGRKEQILSSDQDNGIVYNDSIAHHKNTLLELAESINRDLNEIGFIYCPANVMAKNPFFNRSFDEWMETIQGWVETPEEKAIMYLTIVMDYRIVYGSRELKETCERFLEKLWNNDLAMMKLTENALSNPPPLNFFRSFIVEKSGEHIDKFNIKKRAIIPIVDITRTLAIHHGFLQENSTIARLNFLELKDSEHADTYQSLRDAFLTLQNHRIVAGLRDGTSGSFLKIDELSKLERQKLRVIFQVIEDGLSILRAKFLINRGL